MFQSTLQYLIKALLLVVLFASCQTKELFEQVTLHPEHKWAGKQVNEYQFSITDTNAAYKVYFVIRHHNAYHYKNIWIELNTIAPNDSITKQSVNLNLADNEKGWLGTGMDDIYDQRIPIGTDAVHFKKGLYKFKLQHTMREDPLDNVLSTGIRVEKIKP